MVRVILNGSDTSAYIGSWLVDGPAVVDCDYFTSGAETFERGVVLITDNGTELVATRHPSELGQDPYSLSAFACILFVLGLLWSRASISR